MRAPLWITVAAFVTLIVCALLVAKWLPLGIHGQWEWGRWDEPTPWVYWLTSGVLAVLYIAGVSLGARWMLGNRWAKRAALLGLVVAGFAVQMGMQQLGFGLGKWAFVLYNQSSSGYYTAAKRDVQSAGEFLADYELIQREYLDRHGPLHLATHPPGLVLMHYASLRLCETKPAVTRLLRALQPRQVADGFREVVLGRAIPPADQASIWLVALASQLASALVVIPIYLLARRGSGPEAAWWAAALWPLVPAVTIFMPKSDVLYPLFAATSAAIAVTGRTTLERLLFGLAAAIALCCGMFLSFGLITIAPLVMLAVALSDYVNFKDLLRRLAPIAAAFMLLVSSAEIVLRYAADYSLLGAWWRCYSIHATFYNPGQVGAGRTYWSWVGFNIAEFTVATGLPLIVAAIAGSVRLFRPRREGQTSAPAMPIPSDRSPQAVTIARAVIVSWWLILLILDLSGKNRGEIARLWIFMMPLACVAAAPAIEQLCSARWRSALVLLLLLQAGQTAAFAAQVQGFYDPSSIGIATSEGREGEGVKG